MTAAPLSEFLEPAEDRGDLAEIYRAMFAPLVRYARRRLPKESDPEDIVQDSFMKVLERVDVGALGSAPAFLTKVVQNGVIAELRSRAVRERRSAAMSDPEVSDPTLEIEDQELLEAASELVDRLPPRQRRLLGLYLLGLSPSEIATVESQEGEPVNANQVSTTLTRAKSRLRSNLKENGFAVIPIWWKDLTRWARWKLAKAQWFMGAEFAATATAMVLATAVVLGITIGGTDQVGATGSHKRSTHSAAGPSVPQLKSHVPPVPHTSAVSKGSSQQLVSVPVADEVSVDVWKEADGQAPGAADQLLEWIGNPGGIPIPGCKGLPICP